MAKLRMFANLREIAGTSRAEVEGDTVAGVIAAAAERYGNEFAKGLETSRIWVNGEEAGAEQAVGPDDEVVILPPVSGGSQQMSVPAIQPLAFVPLLVTVIVILANMRGQEIWAAALVAIVSVWALDVGAAFAARGRLFAPLAVATSAAAGVIAAHAAGGAGFGLALAMSAAISLGWAVAFPMYRHVEVFAPTALAAVLGAMATASLVLSRSAHAADAALVDIFLVAVVGGLLLGAIVARMPAVPFLDPISTTAVVAVVGSVVAAALWDAEVIGYLLLGLGVAVALVGGRGLSSMLRTGAVRLTEPTAGVMPSLDGVIVAAAILYPLAGVIL